MQVRDAFPVDAVTGGDFITGRYEVASGERVVDFDADLDALPAWGRLCVHENTVKLMMTALGWDYDPVLAGKVKEQAAEIARLRKVNKQMRDALVGVAEAAAAAGVTIDRFLTQEPVSA
jgi:hypothetical protein